jgi:pimeloyl-ACP methyl ester carboxylesterase
LPNCQMSEYVGVGHAPFIEDPVRFNAELAAFARRGSGTV